MKKKLGIILVVALFVLVAITLCSCTLFKGGSEPAPERSDIKENHGFPIALEITSPASSRSAAIAVDDFDLSMVKAKVRYVKDVVNADGDLVKEYWVDDSSEFALNDSKVEIDNPWVLTDLNALAEEKNTVYVTYASNLKDEYGYNAELTGSFVLYLKQSESVTYSQIKFNLNGGIAGFVGTNNADGTISATVKTGTSYTWSEFIAAYPVTPPTGKALSAWGHYSSGSRISVDGNIELTAQWTENSLTVSFDVNNNSTDYSTVPVGPTFQSVQIKDGFVARPSTSTMETFYGYEFAGWYKEKTCENIWNFTADLKGNNYTSSSNFTLYAKWEERKFTVKFNLLDGLVSSSQLQAMVTGVPTTDNTIPTMEKFNFAVAAYVTYTDDAGALSYYSISTTEKVGAKRIVFNNRQYPLTSALAEGDYYFDYQNTRYYFSIPNTLAKSSKGLEIGCAPSTLTYSDLKIGDKYFEKDGGDYKGILLASGVENLENTKSIYKGLASFLDSSSNKIYFYEFNGWYTSPTFETNTLFTFANNDGSSREVVLADYPRVGTSYVLQLYAKWTVVDNEYRDLYLSDYLFKNTLTLKSDGTVRVDGISDSSANVISIPKTIKYDFDGDGEFDKDSGNNEINYEISEIGYKAFYGNAKIVEIIFDDDSEITTIDDGAFAYCTSLTNINIFELDEIQKVGSDILKGTTWLTNYRETHDYLVLKDILVQYTGLSSVDVINMNSSAELDGKDIKTISSGAFAGLQKLIKIEILDSIETIENLAFQGDTKLIVVDFTKDTSISYVGESAFYQTAWIAGTNFVRATLYDENVDYYVATEDGFVDAADKNMTPKSQADIDDPTKDYFIETVIANENQCLILGNIYYRYTGSSNKAYTTANIPAESDAGFIVTKIAANAFSGYSNIKSIVFENVKNIISIGQNAFADTAWSTMGVNKADSYTETLADNSDHVAVKSATYVSADGFCVINGILVEYFGPASAANPAVILPKNIRSIARGVFSKHDGINVTNLLIPDGAILEKIDDYAFISATSLKGISFIDEDLAENITFGEKAFFTTNDGSVTPTFTFYFTKPNGTDFDTYLAQIQGLSTWSKYLVYNEYKFEELVVTTTEINPQAGIPTKYIINSSAANALNLRDAWSSIISYDSDTMAYIANGLKVTRNDGISTTQDLYLEKPGNFVYVIKKPDNTPADTTFSASDIVGKAFGSYALKFELQEHSYDSEYIFYVYPGIQTAEFNGLKETYYTSQKTLPKSGDEYYVKVTLYNGFVDYFRLDNTPFEEIIDGHADVRTDAHAELCKITISNYNYTKGTAKSLAITLNYNSLQTYVYSHTYNTVDAEVVTFEQASSFLFAANSNASLNYSNCFFNLIYEDGSSKRMSMNMGKFSVSQVFMETTNQYEPMDYLDTKDLGLRQAKITYEGLDGVEVTILYIVYIGTLPDVFTYDFKVVGGEYIATVTGISTAYASSYDSTLVLPTTVVRSETIDPLSYDDKEYTVVAIADNAFKNKTRLTDVYIANTITTIGNSAFSGCTNLVNVYTFDLGINKSAGYDAYYLGPNNAANCIEAYSETATYFARAYITSINTKGASSIVVPFEIEGKSGTEDIATNIKMENHFAEYTGETFNYTVNYTYVLTPIIEGKEVDVIDPDSGDPTGEKEFKCILNEFSGFEGVVYLPKTDYYIDLKAKVEAAAGDNGLGYSIYLYEKDEANIPAATTAKFTYKGNSSATSKFINNLNYDIDMCYRTGNVVLLENAHLPVTDHQVYIPGHFNGTYTGSKDVVIETIPTVDTYDVYYDYTLTSVMDSCLHYAYTQGMTEVYVPYTIFNVWCDIDDFLLYATDMNSYKAAHPEQTTQQCIDARTEENYNIVAEVNKYQYTAGDMLSGRYVRSSTTGGYVAHEATYDEDTAYAVARHFSSTVKVIGENAFENCSSLKNIDLSYATVLEEIGSAAFKGCTSLESIDLSKTKITSIEGSTFYECRSLANVVIPKTVVEICGQAFHAVGITDYNNFVVDGTNSTATLIICDYAFHLVELDGNALVTYLQGKYNDVDVNIALAFSGD